MRRLVHPWVGVPLLLLSVSCSTNMSGLGEGGSGGLGGTAAGNRGGMGVGGGTGGAGARAGMGGTATGAAGNLGGGAGTATGGAPGGQAGGAAGQAGGAGNGAGGPGESGASCVMASDCLSGFCVDGTCCQTACSGICRSCANRTGTCTAVPSGMDPRNDCPATSPGQCGVSGLGCNGAGACILWPAGTVCDATVACDSTASSMIPSSVCDGQGNCRPGAPVSCNGFACAAGACGTDCVDDSSCVAGGYCSAHACITRTNLAGNGDLETGTVTGWSAFPGGAADLSSTDVHAGEYSVEVAGRATFYAGPGYWLPTGLGQYAISFWAMQNEDNVSPDGLFQIRLTCASGDTYYAGYVDAPLPQGVWVNYATVIDTSTTSVVGPDCFPDGRITGLPGLVRSAELIFGQSQNQTASPASYPALYLDDLVVQVVDGHNLVGNPTFEAGYLDGWGTNGVGTALVAVSGTYANSGTKSLQESARSSPGSGIRYQLPIGAARYDVAFNVMQMGTATHPLQLQAAYVCIGDNTVRTPANTVVTTDALAPGLFVPLTGTFTFPPADAPANCELSEAAVWVTQAETGTCASVGECPDLYLDDASITLH